MGESLWRWVVHKFDTLLDAAFQLFFASLDKLLLLVIYVREDIDGLLHSRRLKAVSISNKGENSVPDVPRARLAQRSNQRQFLW